MFFLNLLQTHHDNVATDEGHCVFISVETGLRKTYYTGEQGVYLFTNLLSYEILI